MTGNNQAVNESLSALLDGEHTELDLRRVLKAAETDSAVAEKWASYQLTRQLISKELDAQCRGGFLQGIQEAIADEGVSNTKSSTFSRWQRYATQGAVAACFTFVFLIGATQWSQNNAGQPDQSLASQAGSAESLAVVPQGFELPPLTARTVSNVPAGANSNVSSPAFPLRSQASGQAQLQEVVLSAEQQALLERLMLKHADSSAANGGLGVMPYTRANTNELAE